MKKVRKVNKHMGGLLEATGDVKAGGRDIFRSATSGELVRDSQSVSSLGTVANPLC